MAKTPSSEGSQKNNYLTKILTVDDASIALSKGSAEMRKLISDGADDSEVTKVDDMRDDMSQKSRIKTDGEKKRTTKSPKSSQKRRVNDNDERVSYEVKPANDEKDSPMAKRKKKHDKSPKKEKSPKKGTTSTKKDDRALTPECDELEFYKSTVPDKIKDINGKCAIDDDYDPRTLQVPGDFLLKQSPTMRQWWTLKSQYNDTILFFKMQKNYHLFYMDAMIGVKELGLHLKSNKKSRDQCSIPEISYVKFSDILIQKGYKVGRVEATETADQMVERCKLLEPDSKVLRRELFSVQSRGTKKSSFIDGDCCHDDHNFLLAISEKINPSHLSEPTYGVCFVDVMIGTIHVGEFEDDRYRSRLRTLVSHFPPSQVLYEKGKMSEKARNVINSCSSQYIMEGLRSGVEFWNGHKTLKVLSEADYFVVDDKGLKWPQVFDEMMSKESLWPRKNFGQALSALGAVVWYLRRCLMDEELLSLRSFEIYTPVDATPEPSREVGKDGSSVMTDKRMVLDDVTLLHMNVIVNSSTGTSEGTLLQKLDNCKTPFGKRLIKKWLCSPPRSIDVINDRLNAMEDIMLTADVVSEVSDILSKLPDLERLLNKIHTYSLSRRTHPDSRAVFVENVTYNKRKMEEFINCLEGFKSAKLIVEKFKDSVGSFKSNLLKSSVMLKGSQGKFPDLTELLDFFDASFDHQEAKEKGVIKQFAEGVNEKYDAALINIEFSMENLDKCLEDLKRLLKCKDLTYFHTAEKRYQVEVPSWLGWKMPEGYELTSERKGFKHYQNEKMKKFFKWLVEAEQRRDGVEKDTMRCIFEQFDKHRSLWTEAIQCLSVLDALISLANYSSQSDMCRSEFVLNKDKSILEIRGGCHPCMERNVWGNDFIPNDIVIGDESSSSSSSPHALLVTGPFMSGKSTLMRQVGLSCIIAQLGCYVPAKKCRLSPVDKIFACAKSGEAECMQKHVTEYSLVLLDERSYGTKSLETKKRPKKYFQSLVNSIQCRTIFSTRDHSIVSRFSSNPCVSLGHMVMHKMWLVKKQANALNGAPDSQACEIDPMKFLADYYVNLQNKRDLIPECVDIINKHALWLFDCQFELFDCSPRRHIKSMLRHNNPKEDDLHLSFYAQLATYIKVKEGSDQLFYRFEYLLEALFEDFKIYRKSVEMSSAVQKLRRPPLMSFFTRNENLARLILEYEKKIQSNTNASFLFNLLSLGTNPKYFADVNDAEIITQVENQIQEFMKELQYATYEFFSKLMSFEGQVQTSLMVWIGKALDIYVRKDREGDFARSFANINFLLNIKSILLRLFKPHLRDRSNLLKIQVTYCKATCESREVALQKNVHMTNLNVSNLISSDEGSSSVTYLEDHYEIITELFFMLHVSLKLWFSVTDGMWKTLNEEIEEFLKRNKISDNHPNANSSNSILVQPQLLQNLLPFMAFSADLLVHSAMSPLGSSASSLDKAECKAFSEASGKSIPASVVNNLQNFLKFLARNHDNDLFKDENKRNHLGSILEFVLVYMFNSEFISNPIIKENMAETLLIFIPNVGQLDTNIRDMLEHHAMECLINLFVETELELTKKLTYNQFKSRSIIHSIFKHLWSFREHKKAILKLEGFAALHVDRAPLFLRFVDVLVHEAKNLLRGAIDLMTMVRTSMHPGDQGFLERVMDARHCNIIAQHTIVTLAILTSITPNMFCHPIMVDYVAVMSNFYLAHLVGSKQVTLKNLEEFRFRPWDLVLEVCKIYESLAKSDMFLKAVSMDRVSYSSNLLYQASDRLTNYVQMDARKIRFQIIATKIEEMEEDIRDIPQQYFDKFTGFLIREPVKLPDISHAWVDKMTIYRQQFRIPVDPNNRTSLTADMIKIDDEMKSQIDKRKIKLRIRNQ